MSTIKCRIRIVPKERYIDNAWIYPCAKENTAKAEFQRNGIICRPFRAWIARGSRFNAGINPCVEICHPCGTLPPYRLYKHKSRKKVFDKSIEHIKFNFDKRTIET